MDLFSILLYFLNWKWSDTLEEKNGFSEENYDEYEIDLREYIKLVWKHKWFITAFVVLAVLAAFVFSSYFIKPEYKTEAVLSAPNYELLNGQTINSNYYISLFESDDVVNEVLRYVNKEKEDINQLDNADILHKININTEDNNNQINFLLTYNDPEKASLVLKKWLDEFMTKTQSLINDENEKYINRLRRKYEKDYMFYEDSLNIYTEFQSNHNLSLLKKNILSTEDRIIKLKNRNNDFNIEYKSKKSELSF
jgi:LPS O-antigen subunit length determinant protein (WzzB/FepE family)